MNRRIRIFGFLVALSYLIVILASWMFSEFYNGDVYFRAGEPNRFILYSEWLFGIISIAILSIEVKRIADEKDKVIYDLPV